MSKVSIILIVILSFFISNCSLPDPRNEKKLLKIHTVPKATLLKPQKQSDIRDKQECSLSLVYKSCYEVGFLKMNTSLCSSVSDEVGEVLKEQTKDKKLINYGQGSCYMWCLQGITGENKLNKYSLCDSNDINKPSENKKAQMNAVSVYKSTTRYNCNNLTTLEARRYFLAGHTYLDADNDGVPCELNERSTSKSNTGYRSTYSPSYSSGSGSVYVRGYYRKNGTYVRPHRRRSR